MAPRKTTPERPPKKSMESAAGKGLENPRSLKPKEVRSLAGRVLSEGKKPKR
jgi:hypothetical protein